MTHIEDNAMDKAHSKLSRYHDQYNKVTKSVKALKENPSSEKVCYHKAETKQSELKAELEYL